MLSPVVEQLLEEVMGQLGEKKRAEVRENPETYLVSLLQSIRDLLPDNSVMLRTCVELSSFGNAVDAAKRKLEQVA